MMIERQLRAKPQVRRNMLLSKTVSILALRPAETYVVER